VGRRLRKSFEEITIEDWDGAIRTNLSACFYLAHQVVPGMRERNWGRLVSRKLDAPLSEIALIRRLDPAVAAVALRPLPLQPPNVVPSTSTKIASSDGKRVAVDRTSADA
jgi:hypothetical protein